MALAAHSCVLPPGAVTTDATVRTAEVGPANHSGTTSSPFKPQSGDGAVGLHRPDHVDQERRRCEPVAADHRYWDYGTDIVAVSRDWGTVLGNTTTYEILQGMLFEISPDPVTAVIRMCSTSAADVPNGSQRSVPSPGKLPSGPTPNPADAHGVWLRLILPAGATAHKGSADFRILITP